MSYHCKTGRRENEVLRIVEDEKQKDVPSFTGKMIARL